MSFDASKIFAFDLETTSANPFEARIVTSALVHIEPQNIRRQELLADPGVEIPEDATKIHGISTAQARAEGQPHDEVLAHTIATIRSAWEEGFTLVAFNAAYDLSVLHSLDPSFTVDGPVFDPYVIDRAKDKYRKGARTLAATCEHYGVKLEQAHDATADALAAARVAWKMVKHAYPDLATLPDDDLMEFQALSYFEFQQSRRRYLEGQGKDPSSVHTTWPIQAPGHRPS